MTPIPISQTAIHGIAARSIFGALALRPRVSS